MPSETRPAAFFDMDKTLLTVNSGRLWIDHERRHGRIGRRHVAMGLWYLLRYRFGSLDMERVMGAALKTVRGVPERDVRAWTESWFDGDVAQHAAPGAWPFLDAHAASGHPRVLLTSSSPYASKKAVELFGLEGFLCTRFEVHEGEFTGKLELPVCFGDGKVALAERYADEHAIDLDRSWFYTDSMTDLPMLERVGHPVIVHPDPRLKRHAVRRGWPILDWHTDGTPQATELLAVLKAAT